MAKTPQDTTMDILKGTARSLDFQTLIEEQNSMLFNVKRQLKDHHDATDEKFFKKYEEKEKELKVLAESWIKKAYPEDKHAWISGYDITIVITSK